MAYSTDKLAVITGASSGIGRALAQQLNRESCRLALCDVDVVGLQSTLDSLERDDIATTIHTLDVSNREAVHQLANELKLQHGHIDILINNAGVALMASAEEAQYQDLEWLMDINFWGVVYGSKAFLPLLRNSPQGHLVNLSSIFGVIAVPSQSIYNAAKFAVRGYTEALRHELADSNVHVCCVHPGGIKTNIARNSRIQGDEKEKRESIEHFDQLARTSAESAAAQIIQAIEQKKVRLLIGRDAKLLSLVARLSPTNYWAWINRLSNPLGFWKS